MMMPPDLLCSAIWAPEPTWLRTGGIPRHAVLSRSGHVCAAGISCIRARVWNFCFPASEPTSPPINAQMKTVAGVLRRRLNSQGFDTLTFSTCCASRQAPAAAPLNRPMDPDNRGGGPSCSVVPERLRLLHRSWSHSRFAVVKKNSVYIRELFLSTNLIACLLTLYAPSCPPSIYNPDSRSEQNISETLQ